NDMILKLNWGGGIYDVASPNAAGQMITATPARFVGDVQSQYILSGYQQQQMANDINQMVGSLYAGLSTRLLSHSGLTGLTQSNAGQPSYLDQVVSNAAQELRSGAANTGLSLVQSMRNIELAYFTALSNILRTLTGSSGGYKTLENQCWNNIIAKACAAGTL